VDPTFWWMRRLTNYCVTVVEQRDPARVLAAFGADPDTAVVGDAHDELGLYGHATGYRPVVRVAGHGQWCVAVENFSFEGVREPVLRRLSAAGRVVSVSLNHLPEFTMGFAESGDVVGPFPVPTRQDPAWLQLEAVAGRTGVSLADWSDDDKPRSAVDFAGTVCGFPLDDSVVSVPGILGVMLPLLPVSFVSTGPVRSELEARIVALTESGTSEQLAPAAAEQVRAMLIEAGVAAREILAAVAEPFGGVVDDSAAGRALRQVIAEEYVVVGSPMGPPIENLDVQAVRDRVSAGVTAAALLRSGPKAAVAEMLHRRLGTEWRAQLVAGWESVVATPAAINAAAEQLAAHQASRARSRLVSTYVLPRLDEVGGQRARAVPLGPRRPTPAETNDADETYK
jgi:hypothetical protein